MRGDLVRGLTGLLVMAGVGLTGCTDIEQAMASLETLNFMHDSPSLDPYDAPRDPPPLSVPLAGPGGKWEPAVEQTEAALRAWGDTLTNPFGMDERVLTAGARGYQTYCAVCHGTSGQGDGPMVGPGKLPFATNLLLPATEARTDGYLYAVVRVGRGLMPSYQRMPVHERWAVVNYLRHLQGGGQPMRVELPGTVQPGLSGFNTADAQGAGAAAQDTDTAGRE